MFTGDRSGDFLYAQLHRAGFANQPSSVHANDGLALQGAYITAAVRCAPPDNMPLPSERENCAPYLQREFQLLQPKAVLALGGIAFTAVIRLLVRSGITGARAQYKFEHGAEYELPDAHIHLFASYHPSQQNTQTGRLTPAMMLAVLERIRRVLDMDSAPRRRRSS
jgi:uracil-DNA glycosylase family 4